LVEDHAAVRPGVKRENFVPVDFAILYRSISKLAGIFPIGRAIQICTLRLLPAHPGREDMFPQGVAENSAEE
jgi:hypothetical protein